jgi:hypothetical protein
MEVAPLWAICNWGLVISYKLKKRLYTEDLVQCHLDHLSNLDLTPDLTFPDLLWSDSPLSPF